MADNPLNTPNNDVLTPARKTSVPLWKYVGAVIQIGFASLIMPSYVLGIQTGWSALPLLAIPPILVSGVGLGVAVAFIIITNIIFIWRCHSGRDVKNESGTRKSRFRVKQAYGSALHFIVASILVGLVIVILTIYGSDLFGLASSMTLMILAGVVIFGYVGMLYAGGFMGLYFEKLHKHHEPPATVGAGFRSMGLILLVTLPVAGASMLFVNCNSTYTLPAEITVHSDLFISGENGYNTYKIPVLIVSPNGTILAFCEARKDSNADHGDIQIVMRKSYDNGQTWTPMQIFVNAGPITAGNACPLLDRTTSTIWMLYNINNLQTFVIKSTDNGETWSAPRDITTNVTDSSWTWIGTGPGHGIQLASGRLYVPTYHIIGTHQYCGGMYSDDHGVTWKTSAYIDGLFEESQAVQLVNGTVLLSMRPDSGVNLRVNAWSQDNGSTWSAPAYDPTLISPSCQGSIIRYTNTTSFANNRIILSNPASTRRENMVVRLSYDEARTWRYSQVLWAGPAGYSDLAITKTMQVCNLFECGLSPCSNYYERITFARYNLTWLTSGADATL